MTSATSKELLTPLSLAGCHWRMGGHTPDLSENWLVETRHGASLHLAE
ncbi:MAG: hypothetical protein F6J92_24065 [Symploca sp. SIO1A3]|nr:hypothetical protein [Symploca sp. SIO1A3]